MVACVGASFASQCVLRCCTKSQVVFSFCGFSLRFLPANRRKKEVDPTRLELVTSAMRGRDEGFTTVHHRSKTCISKLIPRTDPPRMFTTVRARCRQIVVKLASLRPANPLPVLTGNPALELPTTLSWHRVRPQRG